VPDASSVIVAITGGASISGRRVPEGVRGKRPVTSNVPLMRLSYSGLASASTLNTPPIRSRSRFATVPRAPYEISPGISLNSPVVPLASVAPSTTDSFRVAVPLMLGPSPMT
jgi:hypothetical protein